MAIWELLGPIYHAQHFIEKQAWPIDLFTVSDVILLGGKHSSKHYSKCIGKVKSLMSNNFRVINILKILWLTGKRYPASVWFSYQILRTYMVFHTNGFKFSCEVLPVFYRGMYGKIKTF